MRRRLLTSTALIALASVLVLGIPLGLVGSSLLQQRTEQRLEREADAVAGKLALLIARGRPVTASTLDALASPGDRLEATLADGTRVAGGSPISGKVTRVRSGSSAPVAVTALAPAHERTESIGKVWLAVILLSMLAVGVAVGLALLQARRLAWPLEQLAAQARAIGGDEVVAHDQTGIAEIDRVGRTLAAAARRATDALQREREFSANVSHQLRSPLTALRLRLEELTTASAPPEVADEARAALVQADRLLETIAGLERLSSSSGERAARVDLARLAREHVNEIWSPRFAKAGRVVCVAPADGVWGRLDAQDARQLLDVLLDNALGHGAGAATVTLGADESWTRMVVEDEGPGVTPEVAHRVFERRWSGAGGSGIGLALARELVRQAGGELTLTRRSPPRFEALVRAGEPRQAAASSSSAAPPK